MQHAVLSHQNTFRKCITLAARLSDSDLWSECDSLQGRRLFTSNLQSNGEKNTKGGLLPHADEKQGSEGDRAATGAGLTSERAGEAC